MRDHLAEEPVYTFTLRTSSKCKSVQLLGSWDKYTDQLPLSKDISESGGWKGAFRFRGSTLQQGKRYWYYVRLIPQEVKALRDLTEK